MQAVLLKEPGDVKNLYIGETETPKAKAGEVLIRVRASALNRADLLQRRGLYPPPAGASPIIGLEAAGEVVQAGAGATRWKAGDRVVALLPGGGYAQYAAIPEGMCMPVPENMSFEEAAAIPEVFLTAYSNLFWLGGLGPGKTVLVHAGASGVGTAAIQLIREAGAESVVTAGSAEKLSFCANLGAKAGWNYHEGSFAAWVREQTGGQGADLILDFIGAPYFADNLKSLAVDGRLIIVGTMGGVDVNVNLGVLLGRRLQVIGTALRSRSPSEKVRLTQEFANYALSKFASGSLKPVVDSVFDWTDVAQAHERMENNRNTGKIVLRIL